MTAQPTIWPQGKSCAVMVAVLFDDGADAIAAAPDLANRSKSLSVWQFGANRGVERLCRTFGTSNVKTSWFLSAETANRHRDLLRGIIGAGHELASSGFSFERHDTLTSDQSLEVLRRSRDALNSLTGKETSGFRLPQGNWPVGFDRLLLEAGYGWSASLNGDDIPYTHPSGLVEIPVHVELEDRPYFQFNFTPAFPKGQSRIPDYEGVLHNWIAEFDAYRRFGLCYVIQLRPEWTGTPGRISLIEDLLGHILSFDDVWVATGAEIAERQRALGPAIPNNHPIRVFETYRMEQRSDG
ncbi:peptidoglycan/xylan/chitin deacetylase (PgdA/CDA1 family) [Mesorhizobium soli]|uniref:polysaccharide deacetylase family protein n=1 Tax=Pseudaminobacter soli (ex Li et al. 2025) TaxID=1295366 RepID=UPI002476F6CA|nr:polysaccharide deacetylase family protein [Mesorhizobium soli]MDH6233326.1 peptidoglycan/xylan/chitin deacetylase (PgdA/CDA1 family) [Mesorhizobium soli]